MNFYYRFFFLFLLLVGFGKPVWAGGEQKKDTSGLKLRAVLPVVYYTPETKIGGGLAAFNYFKLRRGDSISRISNVRLLLLYTQTKQVTVDASSDVYLLQDRLRLTGGAAFFRLPYNFYGVGNNTPESSQEQFTVEFPRFQLNAMWLLGHNFFGGAGFLFEHDELVKVKEGGLLSTRAITGSKGGRLTGPGLLLTYDSRDHNYAPLKGSYIDLNYFWFNKAFGSNYGYRNLEFEARKYLHFGRDRVLAFQGVYNTISGDAPFRRLSLLGSSSIMRGYYSGRYRDNNLLAAQAEYRFQVWEFIGGAVFAGAGDVAPKTTRFDLFDFKPSYGGGIRILVNRKHRIMGRFDAAFGQHSNGYYFSVGQAF